MTYNTRRGQFDYPQVGDIWVWRGIEHYLLLQKVEYAPFTFNTIYLEEGIYMEEVPIDPRDYSWLKAV